MEKGERALSQFTNCVRNPRYAGDQKVKKQLQEKITCECGRKIAYSHKARHLRTPLHKKRMNELQN